jgi:hypothetical protein
MYKLEQAGTQKNVCGGGDKGTKKSMAGRAIARGAQDALSGKFGRRRTSLLARDVLLSQEPLSVGPLGDEARTRPSDGQVRGGMATLLSTGGHQPSCFPGETAQAPFVFHGSRDESTFGAATMLNLRPQIRLRVRAWTQRIDRLQGGNTDRAGSAQTRPPTTGEWRYRTCAEQLHSGVGGLAVSQEYMRSAAALPPGRPGEHNSTNPCGTWPAQRLSQSVAAPSARSESVLRGEWRADNFLPSVRPVTRWHPF